MTRADQLLVRQGLAPSRAAAQRLIERGAVRWRALQGWTAARKAGENLPESCEMQVGDDAEVRYASRGGLKLEGALAQARFAVRGLSCLDLGQSTGGFTDCLLQAGARHVVGVDVGHAQLHPRLRADPRVRAFEGVNVRTLDAARLGDAFPPGGFDLVSADLSFISLAHALHPARALTRKGGRLLALVKPQFEVGPGGVNRRGVVRDPTLYDAVRRTIRDAAHDAGWQLEQWFDSPILGGDGNREFFLLATTCTLPATSA